MRKKENNTPWTWFSYYDNDILVANIYFLRVEDKYFVFDIRVNKPSVRGLLKINPFNLNDFYHDNDIPERTDDVNYYIISFEEAIASIKKNNFKILTKSPVWENSIKEYVKKKGLIWAI